MVQHAINLNTASELLIAALFANPAAARSLVGRRAGKGYLERSDLAALGLVLPPMAGFTSDAFRVSAEATVGDARRTSTRDVLRRPEGPGISILRGE